MSDWEAGSEYHYGCLQGGARPDHPWTKRQVYGGSGRDVMRALLGMLRGKGVERIWLPSYFCQEVVEAIREEFTVATYRDLPVAGTPSSLDELLFAPGDCILFVNHWGVRAAPDFDEPQRQGIVVIEDHTHDPWSAWAYGSRADYCVASLRKCLPIPDGGVVWSPRGEQLPDALSLTPEHQIACHAKLSGMLLKSAYLTGQFLEKDEYRALLQSGEAIMASGVASGISPLSRHLLQCLDVHGWRQRRLDNLEHLTELLKKAEIAPIASSAVPSDQVPLGAVLTLPNAHARDALKNHLIRERIYPAILWPIEAAPTLVDEQLVSQRMLFIHIDGRYTASDIERIAEAIRRFSD